MVSSMQRDQGKKLTQSLKHVCACNFWSRTSINTKNDNDFDNFAISDPHSSALIKSFKMFPPLQCLMIFCLNHFQRFVMSFLFMVTRIIWVNHWAICIIALELSCNWPLSLNWDFWVNVENKGSPRIKNKLAKARKTCKLPGTHSLKKFWPGKVWVEKVWAPNIFIDFLAELDDFKKMNLFSSFSFLTW